MLFYEITSPDGIIFHLFGTVHFSNSKAVITLPEEIKVAFENAKKCIFEISLEESTDVAIYKNLEAHLFQEWSRKNGSESPPPLSWVLKKALRKQYNANSNTLDIILMQATTDQNKVLIPLETLEEHIKLAFGLDFSEDEQESIVWHLVKFSLSRLFKTKNMDTLYLTENMNFDLSSSKECVQRYYRGLFQERDQQMTNKIMEHTDEGGVFVAVGALHLPGITRHFEEAGYTIKEIPLGPRVHSINGGLDEGHQVAAFRTIYSALYKGQSSILSWRGLFPNEETVFDFNLIEEYVQKHPDSRSAKAWDLAKTYYQDMSDVKLFEEIHQYSLKKSSTFLLFHRTRNFSDGEYTEEKISNATSSSRTGKIRDTLYGLSRMPN